MIEPGRHAGFSEDLPLSDQQAMAREIEQLGYRGLWTNENRQRDAFVTCTVWGAATSTIQLGIGVSPAPMRTPHALALSAMSVQEATGGRFILGVGSGVRSSIQREWGFDPGPPLAYMTDLVTSVRQLMAGGPVTYSGPTVQLAGDAISLNPRPVPPPIVVGALGDKMIDLAGRLADGVLLNWTSAERIASARRIVQANAVDRPPAVICGYIRASVDDDRGVAREAVARQVVQYALNPVYRAQFHQMGFEDDLRRLTEGHAAGRIDVTDQLLNGVAAWGTADEVRDSFDRLSDGLDVAIVRIVPARPGLAGVRRVVEALAPK